MKKTIYFLVALLMMTGVTVRAAQYHVTTLAEFNTAWTAYTAGDTIYMASGTYSIGAAKTITKTVSIFAEPTAVTKPALYVGFVITGSPSVFVDGIEGYYDAEGLAAPSGNYFLQSVAGVNSIATISFKNSKFHGYGRDMLRMDNTTSITTLGSLIIDNCLMYDMGRNSASYSVLGVKTAKIGNVLVSNSTFYNCFNGVWYSEQTTPASTVKFLNCTFLKVSSSGSKAVLRCGGNTNAGSSVIVENCIMSESYDATSTNMLLTMSTSATNLGYIKKTVLASNFPATKFTGALAELDTISARSVSYDYSTLTMLTNPSSISGIGDPRWKLNPVTNVPPTIMSVTPANNGNIPVSGSLVVAFSKKVTRSATDTTNITLGNTQLAETNIVVTDSIVRLNYSGLQTDTVYTLTIPDNAFLDSKSAGNGSTVTYTFKTPDTVAPRVTLMSPVDGGCIPTSGVIALQLNEGVKLGSAVATLGATPVTAALSGSNSNLVYLSYSGLTANTYYSLSIPENSILDIYGNSMANSKYTFRTAVAMKGDTALIFTPDATSVNTTGTVTVSANGKPLTFMNVLSAGARSAASYTYAFKCDTVYLPKLPSIGDFSMYVQSGGGADPQIYYLQKLGMDNTWSTIDQVILGYNDRSLVNFANAITKDSVQLRVIKNSSNLWFYNLSVYKYYRNPDNGVKPFVAASNPVASATKVKVNGTITLKFNEAMVAGTGDIKLGSLTLTPTILDSTVSLPYTGLITGSSYTLIVPKGALMDEYKNVCDSFQLSFKSEGNPWVDQLLVSENFQTWDALSATTSLTTKGTVTNYGDSIFFDLYNVAVVPTYPAKSDNGITSVGAIQTQKVAAASSYFILRGLKSVSKAIFKHSYTGSSRGCTISCKGDGDADWVTLFSANTTAAAGQSTELVVNRTNVSLRYQGNTAAQNAYLHDVLVYGKTNLIVPVATSINYANNAVIPHTNGSIVIAFSQKVKRGTGLVSFGNAVVPESNIVISDSIVTINYGTVKTDTSYSFTVKPEAFLNADSTGNKVMIFRTFKTLDTILPTLNKISISSGALMPVNGFISLLMSEPCKAGSATISMGSKTLTAVVSGSNSNLIYINYSGLGYDTDYSVSVPTNAITDLTGNSYAGTSFNFHTGIETAGDTLIQWVPTATSVPTTAAGKVRIAIAATPADSMVLDSVVSAGARTSSTFTYAFRCNSVVLPTLPSLGEFNMYVQCAGGLVPQQYFLQKQINDSTWSTIETFVIGTNDAVTIRSSVAQSSVPTKLRLQWDGTQIWVYSVNAFSYKLKMAPDDGINPHVVSSVPADMSTGATINGNIKLTFNESILPGTYAFNLNGQVLPVTIIGSTLTLPYNNLKFSTTYSMIIHAGAVLDKYLHPCVADTLTFTTKAKPIVTAKLFDYVVASDGSGNGTTIQAAFNAVPANNTTPYLIFVKNGIYAERPTLAETKPFVSLIGQHKDSVIITGDKRSGVDGFSTSTCQTMEILADNFYCENITMQNTAGVNAGQAVALKVYADKAVFKNVVLKSYQDTHLTSNTGTDRQYYLNCDIRGTVDYIFGNGVAYFDECKLYMEDRSNGDVICAPATSAENTYGYVFSNCKVDGASSQDGKFDLGRPWQNAPRAVFLNTTYNIIPEAAGWINMSTIPALFAEYGSVNSAYNALDLSKRNRNFSYIDGSNATINGTSPTAVLTASEAAAYTLSNVLGGTDSWVAGTKTETTAAPTNLVAAGTKLNWDAVDGAISYLVSINGKLTSMTTTNSLNLIAGTRKYEIVAVSEYGAISLAGSITVNYVPVALDHQAVVIPSVKNTLVSETVEFNHPEAIRSLEVYSISGQRVASVNASAAGSIAESGIRASDWKPGFYLVNMKLSDGRILTTKVIKK